MLTTDTYLAHVLAQTEALAVDATTTGPALRVPSCPGWTVADLLAHLGQVHRWATAHVSEPGSAPDFAALERQRPADEDLPAWLRNGAFDLHQALTAAPEDLQARTFLKDAPAPRLFWSRRQCHETTVHRVDGLAARLGRLPTAEEVDVSTELALDGLDELLTGFVPRSRSRLRSATPLRLLVRPTDSDERWTVTVTEAPPVTVREQIEHDAVLTGTAAQLYLGLWNRGDEFVADGDPRAADLWRELQRV